MQIRIIKTIIKIKMTGLIKGNENAKIVSVN